MGRGVGEGLFGGGESCVEVWVRRVGGRGGRLVDRVGRTWVETWVEPWIVAWEEALGGG